MDPTVQSGPARPSHFRRLVSQHQTLLVSLLFAMLMAAQAVCYLRLGTGPQARGLSAFLLDVHSLIAIACAWIAFRRAHGSAALFWFLFNATLVILLIPNFILAYDSLFNHSTLSDSTWRLLFCLYGAPIVMMLFLPDTHRRAQLKWETFLDLFQVTVVVSLVYSTFFFLPVQTMAPGDALLRNLTVSNLHSLFLLLAALVRLQFARGSGTRSLLSRLSLFLLVCAVTTLIGDWIDLHHYSAASAWFDLGWALPQLAAALVALTWRPAAEASSDVEPAKFLSFLSTNLVLVAMLCGVSLLMDRWEAANGTLLADIAIVAMMLAFTFRLALTQFHQQREITHRQAAQAQLTVANHKVGVLLDDARRQTQEITQVSELASLLQACVSQQEAFRLIPDRLRRLFPGASGCISLLSSSRNHAESVAEWGPYPPADQVFAPQECWALRRGCTHSHPGGPSALNCTHLLGEGPSVCIPLIANGDTIGTVALQDDAPPSFSADPDTINNAFTRRRHLAGAIAEHIAVAVANLSLREALRLQAARDPLTALYNRRYMEEFLDRELHRALRTRRPVAVLMLDLDHFKHYNDTLGHAAGDQALAAVAEILLRSVRAEDVACRYGGEEFAVILPECSLQNALIRAEAIRQNLKQCHLQHNGKARRPLTVSIGIAAFDETTDRVDLLLKCADEALYRAKRAGRDCVVVADPAVSAPGPDPAPDFDSNSATTDGTKAVAASTPK